jgi:Ca2+-binding EF-hand superfamily protein
VVGYVDQVLRRYDRNGNGKLERDEWSAARWRSDPAASDLNKDGVLTREELCERVKTYDEFRGLSNSSSSGGGSGSPATDKAKLEEYAKGLMNRYDDNDNGVLEADEYEDMSSFHRGADANGDKVITRDELAVRLANYGSSGGDGGSKSGDSDDGDRDERRGNSTSNNKAYRATGNRSSQGYRARTATERLPKGLPDWFARNDADGDGQISMAEYAVSWTDDKVEEFAEHDANGDGLITPQECLGDRPAKPQEKSDERSRDRRSRGR